jgi:UTP--glucose-1-phosphate uridylyltransferase
MSITDAVIPVAGLGTRLLPATRSQPKEMLPVLDKPVVQYVVEELAAAGVERVLFVTGRRKRAIEDHFDADPELEQALGVEQAADPRGGIVVAHDAAPRTAYLEVTQVIEKPDPGAVTSRLAVAARYVLGPEVFAALRVTAPDHSGEVQLADALRAVIGSGGRVVAVPLAPSERRHDIGTVEGYCATFLEYALNDPLLGPGLRARAAELLGHGV